MQNNLKIRDKFSKSLNRLSQAYDPTKELPKWISYSSILLSFVVGALICLIQRVVRPFFVLRVSRINTMRIGHMLLEIDWYLSEFDMKSMDLFFFTTKNPVNSYLGWFAEKRIRVVSKVFLFGAYVLNRLIPGGEKYLVSIPFESFDFQIFDSSPGPLTPDLEFELQGEQLLSKLGIKSESAIVCFYIRDGMYGRKTFPSLDQEFADYRDSDIDDFVPAMEFLAKQGFTVIRMGREGNSQVNSKHPNVIDYCFSAHKSDFADFFLTSKAEFAICTDTGMVHLPLFFRKPIGIANIAGIHGLLHTKMVKFITFKRCFDNKLMRNLSLSEILNSDLIGYKDNYMFHNAGIIFVDSSPDELVGLVKDMFYFISSSSFSNSKSRKLNIEFQDLVFTKRKIKMWSRISHTWLQNNRDFLE